jgi:hypothetical protein
MLAIRLLIPFVLGFTIMWGIAGSYHALFGVYL